MLRSEPALRIALHLRVFDPRRLEPDIPPRIAHIDDLEPQEVRRFFHPAYSGRQGRAQHGRETRLDELMCLQPRPFAEAASDRDVHISRRKIDHAVGRIEPDRE